MVKQRALAPLASASDLADVGRCVAMVAVCCTALETERGICLGPAVVPELWGHMEGEGSAWDRRSSRSCGDTWRVRRRIRHGLLPAGAQGFSRSAYSRGG